MISSPKSQQKVKLYKVKIDNQMVWSHAFDDSNKLGNWRIFKNLVSKVSNNHFMTNDIYMCKMYYKDSF